MGPRNLPQACETESGALGDGLIQCSLCGDRQSVGKEQFETQ